MIQFDDETRSLLSDLLKSTADLEDMFPRSGDEKISDPIKFALTLGEAIGVRKVCKQLGCKEDELLKSEMTCAEMTIAKGKGCLKESQNSHNEFLIKLMDKRAEQLSEYLYLGQKYINKSLDFNFKTGKNDVIFAISLTHSLSYALGVAMVCKEYITENACYEFVDSYNRLNKIICESKDISSKIVESMPKVSLRGRRKSESKTLLAIVGNTDMYNRIIDLNKKSKIEGVKIGYLYVVLKDMGYINAFVDKKTFYYALKNEFGDIGSRRGLTEIASNYTKGTLSEKQQKKMEEFRSMI